MSTELDSKTLVEILDELRVLNEWFQGDEVDIEKSIVKYKEGILLIAAARQKLQKIENEFVEVTDSSLPSTQDTHEISDN